MTQKFKDLNSATAYYAQQLLHVAKIPSTNPQNSNRYKNELGGELSQEFFIIQDPTKVVGTWENHKPHEWWMFGEILSEMLNLDPPIMYKYRPELFSQHYDLLDDGRMQYTYSNRFVEFNQFVNTFRRLKQNPNSKRAMISIFTPYDTSPDRSDAPCTTGYQFLHRDGKLNMTVFFRSHDFFGGFKTYDLALTSFIQQSLCSWLEMTPGQLGVYENSLHYYNRDREKLEALAEEISDSNKHSGELRIDGNLGIRDFYDDLRRVKLSEEHAYAGNFEAAYQIRDSLRNTLFQRISDVYIDRNKKRLKQNE